MTLGDLQDTEMRKSFPDVSHLLWVSMQTTTRGTGGLVQAKCCHIFPEWCQLGGDGGIWGVASDPQREAGAVGEEDQNPL